MTCPYCLVPWRFCQNTVVHPYGDDNQAFTHYIRQLYRFELAKPTVVQNVLQMTSLFVLLTPQRAPSVDEVSANASNADFWWTVSDNPDWINVIRHAGDASLVNINSLINYPVQIFDLETPWVSMVKELHPMWTFRNRENIHTTCVHSCIFEENQLFLFRVTVSIHMIDSSLEELIRFCQYFQVSSRLSVYDMDLNRSDFALNHVTPYSVPSNKISLESIRKVEEEHALVFSKQGILSFGLYNFKWIYFLHHNGFLSETPLQSSSQAAKRGGVICTNPENLSSFYKYIESTVSSTCTEFVYSKHDVICPNTQRVIVNHPDCFKSEQLMHASILWFILPIGFHSDQLSHCLSHFQCPRMTGDKDDSFINLHLCSKIVFLDL